MNKGVLMIYGCGGTGIELAKAFHNHPSQEGIADIKTCYIDTSKSNIGHLADTERFLLVDDDVDGNAKIRKSNTPLIKEAAGLVPKRFSAGDINVVIYAGAGGSGSVIGPFVATELLKQQNAPVINIVIGSAESLIEAENTLNTIASLDSMARKNAKKPMLMSFHNNYDGAATKQVDQNVKILIGTLALLASGEHRGLDSEDLAVWADFCRSPKVSVEPQLVEIKVVRSVDELKRIPYPISLVSISKEKTAAGIASANYGCYGLFSSAIPGDPEELHFVTHTSGLADTIDEVESLLSNLQEIERLRPISKPINVGIESDDDGMVM